MKPKFAKNESSECASRATSSEKLFPYLKTPELCDQARQNLEGRLFQESFDMDVLFNSFMFDTIESLKRRDVTQKELFKTLMFLKSPTVQLKESDAKIFAYCKKEIRKAESLQDAFEALEPFVSFFNFEIVGLIIQRNGSQEDKINLQAYKAKFDLFCKRRICECPIELFGKSSNDGQIVVKLDDNFEEYTLNALKLFRKKLCGIFDISEHELHVLNISDGCVEITFAFASYLEETFFPLSDKLKRNLEKFGVLKVTTKNYEYDFGEKKKSHGHTSIKKIKQKIKGIVSRRNQSKTSHYPETHYEEIPSFLLDPIAPSCSLEDDSPPDPTNQALPSLHHSSEKTMSGQLEMNPSCKSQGTMQRFMRQRSISADDNVIPALCLNDSPLKPSLLALGFDSVMNELDALPERNIEAATLTDTNPEFWRNTLPLTPDNCSVNADSTKGLEISFETNPHAGFYPGEKVWGRRTDDGKKLTSAVPNIYTQDPLKLQPSEKLFRDLEPVYDTPSQLSTLQATRRHAALIPFPKRNPTSSSNANTSLTVSPFCDSGCSTSTGSLRSDIGRKSTEHRGRYTSSQLESHV